MLGHLIRKEILDHVSSLRFLILSILGALIIWLSLFSGYTYYRDRIEDYRVAQGATEDRLQQIMAADDWLEFNQGYLIHKPPTAMCIFVRGLEPGLGRSASIRGPGFSRRLKWSPMTAEPIFGFFPSLDLGLVVQVVLSLFVLLFTYDAVCGEKEAGTLRLIGSFSVPKDRLLLAKLIGALIPTLIAFGLPLILGLAVMFAMPDVQFTHPELMRLGWVLAAFGLYLTAFICAGLFASSLTHRAATSFVVLLAFWVGTVVVLPRLSLIVAEGVRPAPSVREYQVEKARIQKERLEKHRELRRLWQEERSEPGQEFWRTPEGREAYGLYFNEARGLADDFVTSQRTRLEEAFHNRYNARLALAVTLARFSPAFAVKNAAVRLAGTGLNRQQRFETAYDRHVERGNVWYREASTLDRLRGAHPEKYGERKWDVSDMPRFTYRETWPGEEVETALIDIGILAVWGLVFFAGAYVGILRYDVR